MPKTVVRFSYFTSKGPRRHVDVTYPDGAYLVFGREDAGLPEELLAAHEADCVRMPMRRGERCLNLSNAVAVACTKHCVNGILPVWRPTGS